MPDKYVGTIPVLAGKPWDRAAVELHEYLRKANYAHNLGVDIQAISISGGNTTGTLTALSAGTIYLSASNNLTLSQSGQSIGISGPTLMSLGVSTGGNTAGTTGMVASQVVFYGGSNVSLSQSVSGQSATITWNIHPPIGIAAGTQTATTGTVIFSNSNNVTFGMSGSNTITASVSVAPQTGISAISAGTTLATSGTISFKDTNGVSFGIDGQTVTASVKTDYLTTAAQSNHSHGNPTLALTNITGTTASASNGLTLSLSVGNYITTARASTDAVGLNTALTAGPLAWTVNSSGISLNASSAAGTTSGFSGNAISGSMTHNTAGLALSLSHPAWLTTAAQSDHSHGNPTLALTNLTGTTASASNGFTLSLSAGAGGAGDGYNIIAAGTQTANTTGTVVFSNSNGLTFGMSNSSVITGSFGFYLSAGTTDNASAGSIRFLDQNGVSFGLGAGTRISASVRTDYASSGHSHGNPTLALTNLTGTTASASNGLTISLSAGAGGGVAFSAGTQAATLTQVSFKDTNGISFGLDGSTITASVKQDWAQSTHSHGNPTLALTNLTGTTASASNGLTLSLSAAAPGGGNTLSYYANIDAFCGTQTMTMLQSTSGMFPFMVPYAVSVNFMRLPVSGSVLAASSTAATTGNSSFSGGHWRSFNAVIYTRGAGANSNSLQYYTSTQVGMTYSIAVSCAANSTQHSYSMRYTLPCSSGTTGFTKDYSSSAASLNFHTSHVTDLTGNKILEIPFAMLLTPGQYFLGFGVSSTTSTQRTADLSRGGVAFTHFGVSQINSAWGTLGAATNSSMNIQPGIGSYTTAGGGTTSSVPLTQLSSSASQNLFYFQLMRVT